MLTTLSIRDFVLIKNLTIPFSEGLCVLTGETGAGKSILLDALGLALGGRGDGGFVAPNAKQAVVSAAFDLEINHPAFSHLSNQGLDAEDGPLILRRVISPDGRSRAFINDNPVTIGALKNLGETLVEIHGQHDDRGLLNAKGHRALLDAFGGHKGHLAKLSSAFDVLQEARTHLEALQKEQAKARAEEEYNRHCFEELQALAPEVGEEENLAAARKLMMEGEKSAEQLGDILASLSTEDGVEMKVRSALRRLERLPDAVKEHLGPGIEALARAANDMDEGLTTLMKANEALAFDPDKLDQAEERLFEIRAQARKHQCHPDELPKVLSALSEKLSLLDEGSEALMAAEAKAEEKQKAFEEAAGVLTKARIKAAKKLDQGVSNELGPLKLEKATFQTSIQPLDTENWGPEGAEKVEFLISTNPGAPLAPLIKIASGGELSRFILALKVVLASAGSAPSLIFDEVDRGVGGAVADAVGERLARLSDEAQVLVVTHSPQVAARAGTHFMVGKTNTNGRAETTIVTLNESERQEEIARMLSGAEVTDKARAAAGSLIAGGA